MDTWTPWPPRSLHHPGAVLSLFLEEEQFASLHTPLRLGKWVSRLVVNQKHVHLFDFDESTLVCICLLLPCLEYEDSDNEGLPLVLATLGMNSLLTLNSFGVYGNIICSSVDIP